jgi:hypothetical protein
MSEIDKLVISIKNLNDEARQAQLRFAVCKSVNWADRTMTATGVSDEVDYEGVQLGFGYVDIKPRVNTMCLIGILEGKEALTFLINAEGVELVEVKADTIRINGGLNDGLVKIKELTDRLNALVNIFNSHTHTVATTGTAAAQSGMAAVVTVRAQSFKESDYENKKITQ